MTRKLLIIDDQDEVRGFLKRAAHSLGYEVACCENGAEGVAKCVEWNPDVVLTDIFMPERDGLETIRELRQSVPGIRIIAMSGGGSIGHMDILKTARAMGAQIVLTKPFTRNVLAKAIQTVLEPHPR